MKLSAEEKRRIREARAWAEARRGSAGAPVPTPTLRSLTLGGVLRFLWRALVVVLAILCLVRITVSLMRESVGDETPHVPGTP
jgi:hypothetical protein